MSGNQKTRRRTNATSGFVNFPVNDPKWPSDGQGGMFVRLVVIDSKMEKNFYDKWMCCCGGTQSFHYDESYIGDDASLQAANYPTIDELGQLEREKPIEYLEMMQTFESDHRNEKLHFPWLHLNGENHQHESTQYLCILTLGSTGWSNTDWTCTYEDLTEKGKSLYNLIQELYPECDLFLQMWLDT